MEVGGEGESSACLVLSILEELSGNAVITSVATITVNKLIQHRSSRMLDLQELAVEWWLYCWLYCCLQIWI